MGRKFAYIVRFRQFKIEKNSHEKKASNRLFRVQNMRVRRWHWWIVEFFEIVQCKKAEHLPSSCTNCMNRFELVSLRSEVHVLHVLGVFTLAIKTIKYDFSPDFCCLKKSSRACDFRSKEVKDEIWKWKVACGTVSNFTIVNFFLRTNSNTMNSQSDWIIKV